MQGRIGLLLAGAALAIGGGVAGAVVVAPALVDEQAPVAAFDQAGKEELATPQHTFQVAKKARSMARGARQTINGALPQIDQALSRSQTALDDANRANGRLDASQSVSDVENSQVTTGSTTAFVPLGGPEVTLNVPQSGLIEVFASAKFGNEADGSVAGDGVIALFEDGQKVPVTADDTFGICAVPDLEGSLILSSGSTNEEWIFSTPPALGPIGCGISGAAPGGVLLQRSPGQHTYELRYGDCDCEPEPAAISERVLRVIPRP